MTHTLPNLPYNYDALEPWIDAKTMEIHHGKHHQAYVDKLNAVLGKHPDLAERPLDDLLGSLKTLPIPAADRTAIRNHGGGHANHSLFWTAMAPQKAVDDALVTEVTKRFRSLDAFKKKFTETALGVFGSGWAWLVRDGKGKLTIKGLPNQDSPLTSGLTSVFGLDVWEHAYYLKYQNRRAEYVDAWWHVLKLLP
jgi:Fe-Mn family superoxide dismutase